MTSKLVVNTIEADTGISSVSFASSISMSSTSKFHFSNSGIDIGADTNINRPASGVLGFNINSNERVRITSGGNVGIGTDNPATKTAIVGSDSGDVYLQIANSTTGSDANSGFLVGLKSDEGATLYQMENNYMRFGTNGAERLRIDAGGGLQLGTSTATASKLTVYGANDAAAIFQGSGTGTGAGNGLLVGNNGGTTGLLWNYENGPVKIAAQNAERVRIETDGSCYFGPQIITEADMNWGHDAHQRPLVFSGNQAGESSRCNNRCCKSEYKSGIHKTW